MKEIKAIHIRTGFSEEQAVEPVTMGTQAARE